MKDFSVNHIDQQRENKHLQTQTIMMVGLRTITLKDKGSIIGNRENIIQVVFPKEKDRVKQYL